MQPPPAGFDQLNEREREILARLADGLSDRQIADALFLSTNTVKWYNRHIYSKLGVSSRTQAIAHARALGLLAETTAALPAPRRHALPAEPTPFIGRRRELDDIQQRLASARLLTLTGTGGTGKTRLALRVAAAVAESFAAGAHFVDLAALSDHALVAKAIARALGVLENPGETLPDTLQRALAQRELLLLLDNFEHVLPAAPLLAGLLAAAPQLKLLVTSREALRLSAEHEYPVPPLSLPDPAAATVQSLGQSEAGALFIQRAQMTSPRFQVTAGTALAIAQICARLDGLPLAIELAAARAKLLTPQALLERLDGAGADSPLSALAAGARDAPPRQRTLRDTMAWSHALLAAGEQTLFARLAVFRGGRSLDAIEAVCAHDLPLDVLDGLASLVDKNLVQQRAAPGGEPRLHLLEMIHAYAREQLEASGEAGLLRCRHAEYFVALAERAEPELRLANYGYWCQRFELELDNLRAVLEWSLGPGDVTFGVRLAAALGLFWYGQGYHVEGIHWTRRLLERLDETPRACHAPFLISAGRMAWMVDLDAALRLFTQALAVARELGDQRQIAWAQAFQAYAMLRDPGAALPIAEASLALFRAMDHLPGVAQALNIIGELARMQGNDERARLAYEECLEICRQTGEVVRTYYNLGNLAFVAQHAGDHPRALSLVRQALQLTRETGDTNDVATSLVTYAGSVAALGQARRAALLLGAAEAALERMGALFQPTDQPEIDRVITEVRRQLAEADFRAAWSDGRAMSLDQAITEVLLDH